jgi:hypothetical protein
MIHHEGYETTQDNHSALNAFLHAACLGCLPALRMLVTYYSEGIVYDEDHREAYIWLLIAKALDPASCDPGRQKLHEGRLSRREVIAAQKEARRRFQQLRDEGRITLPEELPPPPDPILPAPKQPGKTAHRSGLDLSDWKVERLSELRLVFFVDNGLITFSHRGHKATKSAAALFSASSLRLLVRHYDALHQGASPVGYHERDLSRFAGSDLPNHKVVTYFNCDLRRIFGLPKREKPFGWIGGRISRSLCLNFQLEVRG